MGDSNEKGLSFYKKIAYGIGDFGSNYCWTFIAGFVMLYFTNILGVSAGVVGTLMMISKILDGITDVFMGRIIDSTHSKMGKARFWLFVSTFPLCITVFLLFNIPGTFTDTTKYIWIFIVYTLMGAVFYTMNNIAYSTLTALVTRKPKDRVSMGSIRFMFAFGALILINSYTMKLVEMFGGGQAGWRVVSILYSVICFVGLMIPVIVLRELSEEQLDNLRKENDEKREKKENFFEGFRILFKNKYFYLLLFANLVSYLLQGIQNGLGIYFVTYNMNDAGLLGTMSIASVVPTIIVLLFVPNLAGKFGVRNAALAGGILSIVGTIVRAWGGYAGMVPILLLGLVIVGAGGAPAAGVGNALIAAADDYSQLKYGKRVTATLYSCSSIGIKVGTGLGTALTGILLDLGGYDGMAAAQTERALAVIENTYLVTPIIGAVIAVIVYIFMNVEKENKKLQVQTENNHNITKK